MQKVKSPARHLRKGAGIIKNEGILSFSIKGLQKVQKITNQKSNKSSRKKKFISLVDTQDVIEANWSSNPYKSKANKKPRLKVINWVMSPPSGGGGHQNIFRFIDFLDTAGYQNNVYLYSTNDKTTIGQVRDNVKNYSSAKNLSFARYEKNKMAKADIVFATGWETAYPVFNEKTNARKMYFIQDFEPYFYPMGTNYVLAENTYKFGFHGITAGGFLSQKLSKEYGMICDNYDFGADAETYRLSNNNERKEIFFYARPVTERRGFDLGIMVLEIFHTAMPEYTINLAGWDVSEYDVPFPYVNHKAMQLDELSGLYNECAAALVISLTNMSLLPLELLACGTIPVVNDGPNNRLVSDNSFIAYTETSPAALAQALIDTVSKKDLLTYSKKAAESTGGADWNAAGKKFISIIEKELE